MRRFIYVGNQDNLGFLFCSHARSQGYDARLLLRGSSINRSDPKYLSKSYDSTHYDWVIKPKLYKPCLKELSSLQDTIFLSTGIEVQHMLQYAPEKLKTCVMIPTGSDLAMWPFVDKSTALLENYLDYRDIFYANRFKLSHIFTSQLDCITAARCLGLSPQLRSFNYPVPTSLLNSIPPISDPKLSKYKYILFLPGRKNGDPRFTHYKGVEKIPAAFDHFFSNLPNTFNKNDILILSTDHGNTGISYHRHHFKRDLLSIVSKHNLQIAFTKNLTSYELWSIFKLSSIIVLDQFGQFHMNLGGIGRRALCTGVS